MRRFFFKKDPKPDADAVDVQKDQSPSEESGRVDRPSPETLTEKSGETKSLGNIVINKSKSLESDSSVEQTHKSAQQLSVRNIESNVIGQKAESEDKNTTKSFEDVDEVEAESSLVNTSTEKSSIRKSRSADKPSESSSKSAERAWVSQKLKEQTDRIEKSRRSFDLDEIYEISESDTNTSSKSMSNEYIPKRSIRRSNDVWMVKVMMDEKGKKSDEDDGKGKGFTDEDDTSVEKSSEYVADGNNKLLEKKSVILRIWKLWSHGKDNLTPEKTKTSDEYESNSSGSEEQLERENTDNLSIDISDEDRRIQYDLKGKRKPEIEYPIDHIINIAGYGKYQKILTCLSGFSGLAGSIHMLNMSIAGHYVICEWKLLRWEHAMLTSMVFSGMVIGSPCFGKLAMQLGPKTSLRIAMLIMFIFSACSALPPNMSTMLLMRGILGFSLGSLNQGIHLCFEYYPSFKRRVALFHITCYYILGIILAIGACWLTQRYFHSWRLFLFATSLPTLFVFIVFKWYPESAAFLLSGPNPDLAYKQLEQLVHMNGKEMPKGRLKPIDDFSKQIGNLADVCRLKFFRSTVLLWYIWFAAGFAYYGLVVMTPIIVTRQTMKGDNYTSEVNAENKSLNPNSPISELFITKLPCIRFTDRNYIDMLWITSGEYVGLLVFYLLIKYTSYKAIVGVSCAISSVLTALLLFNYKNPVFRHVILCINRSNAIGICQVIFVLGSETFPTLLKVIVMNTGWVWFILGGALVPLLVQVLIYNEPTITLSSVAFILFLASIAAAFLPLNI